MTETGVANGQCGSYIGPGKTPTNKGLFQTTRYGVVTYGEAIDSTNTGTGGTAIQMTQGADLVSVDRGVINGDVVTVVAAYSQGASNNDVTDEDTRRPSMMLDLNRSGAPMTWRRFTATPKPRSLWRRAPAKPPMMASS